MRTILNILIDYVWWVFFAFLALTLAYKILSFDNNTHYSHTYEVIPLNGKGILRIEQKYSDWVEPPYNTGDTIHVNDIGRIQQESAFRDFTKPYIIKSIKTKED